MISPGAANVGIIPGEICAPGAVGLVSRSGTLVYQIVHELTQRGIGQSTCVGMGGDPVHGIGFVEALELFQADAETELIVLTGEIGGDDEERAAAFIAESVTKPVVGYIAGFEAPPGKRMGHAGAIVTGSTGTAAAKAEALEAVGAAVGRSPTRVAGPGRGAPGVTEDAPPGRSGVRSDARGPGGPCRGRGSRRVRGARRVCELLGVAGFVLIRAYGLWSWAKIGLLTALLSLRTELVATVHGRPMLPSAAGLGTLHLRFVPMLLTIGFLWLAARAGRRAARAPGPGDLPS